MKFFLSILVLSFLAYTQAHDCKCRIKTQNRIVNGEISEEHSMPWTVSLSYKESGHHFCGGSIMNEKYILTAANCIDKKNKNDIIIKVGLKNLNDEIPTNQIMEIEKIFTKNFKGSNNPGDIAILQLKNNIEFIDGVIEKGCFNLEKKEYSEPLLAAGWGYQNKAYVKYSDEGLIRQNYSNELRQAFFMQNNYCADHLICLNPNEKGQSSCIGDSGTPLHYTQNGITTIDGVLSFLVKEPDFNIMIYCTGETAYSRLSYYADWISEIADFDFCGSGPKTEPKYKKKFLGLF